MKKRESLRERRSERHVGSSGDCSGCTEHAKIRKEIRAATRKSVTAYFKPGLSPKGKVR